MATKKRTIKSTSPINALIESLDEARKIAASFGKRRNRKPKTSAFVESLEAAKKIARQLFGEKKSSSAKRTPKAQPKSFPKRKGTASKASGSLTRKTGQKQPTSRKAKSQPTSKQRGTKAPVSKASSKKTSTKQATPKQVARQVKSIEQILDTSNYKSYAQWSRAVIRNANKIDREIPKGHRFVATYMEGTIKSPFAKIEYLIEFMNTYDASKAFGNVRIDGDDPDRDEAEHLLESIHITQVDSPFAHIREVTKEREAKRMQTQEQLKRAGRLVGTRTPEGKRKNQTQLLREALDLLEAQQKGQKKNATKRKPKQ